ncbi:MAG: isocitrate lyase/phosphoenolpyruvate mutase family protein [Alphaproteobacteria bacterium]|jgi:carboxyvinyl-carboxyphosphonate phosphorylmutase|nr:isocitrate lyase/phosphoenolpyruvate mutase family protein [Alphaproteobacteria bacterium]MDP6833234.1 isocitrate lyase/phosphoenolpyruvate mutase family protein [Alphaproteobacteria bacterium]MDP6876368.1 isocitrate lyase/phosphoenolpyruvate mutase family protein [Alphaproteobacteria bacterium]
MSRWSNRRQRFREILETRQCVYPASVYDPISARIAENIGYEMGMYAGSLASLAVLAAPDLILLTQTEFAQQAHRIGRASELPLFADADHGYGNALNVKRTVEELEFAGLAGLSIEDTDLPQPFGSGGKASLLSIEEGVGKMRAAVEGRSDPDLVIAGRTSAAAMTSIEDAIARAKAYEAAGVDAIFLVGVPSREALETIAVEISVPLLLGGGAKDMREPGWLAGHGVRFLLRGHHTFTASVQAIHDTMQALRDGVEPEDITGTASGDLMRAVTRGGDYARQGKDWL